MRSLPLPRRIALTAAALLALTVTRARAVPVTSYAAGVVTEDRSASSPFNPVYVFTPGERLWVEFTIDEDPGEHYPFPARLAVNLFTEWGFRVVLKSNNLLPGTSEGTVADGGGSLSFAQTDRSIRLSVGPLGGDVEYSRDAGASTQAFAGTLESIGVEDMPVPEPGTLTLGAIGAGGLGLVGLGRRRAVTQAA